MNLTFYGMMRGGKHGIIFWILNNIGNPKSVVDTRIYLDEPNEILYINDPVRTNFIRDTTDTMQIMEKYNNLKNQFVSFEDDYIDINQTYLPDVLKNISKAKKVFIMRDLLNCYCSRKKLFGEDSMYTKNTFEKWKGLYRDYNKLTEDGEDTILILYNRWVTDTNYRHKLADALGIVNYVDNTSFVPSIGSGSSFVGVVKDNNENYLSRYKNIELTEEERKMFLDKEIIDLNKKLFNMDLVQILS